MWPYWSGPFSVLKSNIILHFNIWTINKEKNPFTCRTLSFWKQGYRYARFLRVCKGGCKENGTSEAHYCKKFCYKAFFNTFIILKFFTAPENDAVWVLDFLKLYLLKLHFSPLNPNLMAGNAFSIFLNNYKNNMKYLASFIKNLCSKPFL